MRCADLEWVNSWTGMGEKGAGYSSNSLDNVHNTDWTQGNPRPAVNLSSKQAGFVQSGKHTTASRDNIGSEGFMALNGQ